jgi:hypothetical protein
VKVEAEGSTGLSKPRASERLRTLLRQQKALLTKIKQERKQRERLAESARDTMTAVMSRVQPLVAECAGLSRAIHELFRELLAEGRLPKRSRRQVQEVYETLRESLGAEPAYPSAAGGAFEEDGGDPGAHRFEPALHRAGDAAGKASARDVFRRLALALHPDRARNEEERRQRTEVMKGLSQAYEAGDLAALLEAEQRWLSGAAQATNEPAFDAQCSALERAVSELKEQLRRLRAEVKELKRSPEVAMAQAMKERTRGAPADVIAEAVADVEADAQQLRELLSFVTAFRDKNISLAEFLRGPPSVRSDVADLLFDFLEEELARPRRGAGRRGRRARTAPF